MLNWTRYFHHLPTRNSVTARPRSTRRVPWLFFLCVVAGSRNVAECIRSTNRKKKTKDKRCFTQILKHWSLNISVSSVQAETETTKFQSNVMAVCTTCSVWTHKTHRHASDLFNVSRQTDMADDGAAGFSTPRTGHPAPPLPPTATRPLNGCRLPATPSMERGGNCVQRTRGKKKWWKIAQR